MTAPSPLVGEGYTDASNKLARVRGSCVTLSSSLAATPHPAFMLRMKATLSHKGRGRTERVASASVRMSLHISSPA
ncbi:hypothetical protein BRAS3809_100016 [Bradyrhizobium sp. STM 3809]|nr:hypothetical protein BRAS3809_100016 [Bradyrhizobium sp. STM 3809]